MPEIAARFDKIVIEDTYLASALLTLGCEPFEVCPTQPVEIHGGNGTVQRRFLFKFVDNPKARQFCDVWRDREKWRHFEAENPEHPLCYIRAAFHNRDRYLDAIKQSCVLELRRLPTGGFQLRKRLPPGDCK